LENLPELTRKVFEAHRFYNKTYAEIADELGIPVRRVTTEMQRALSRLKVALKDYLPVSLILLLLDAN
jgi:RNA polymerase sigma-70 factor (ECF subfamily)